MPSSPRRLFVAFLGLTLCSLLGCSGPDRKAQLVGTWRESEKATMTFSADGTFTAQAETGSWGIITPKSFRAAGTWHVSGNDLIIQFDKTTYLNEQLAGLKVIETILAIEENSFRTRDDKGKENVYTRVK